MNGATQAEIDEAIEMASSTRYWSTMFHGLAIDEKTFQKEVDTLIKHVTKMMASAGAAAPKKAN